MVRDAEEVVSDGGRVKINPSTGAGPAIEGSFDILAGTIGSYMARGVPPFQASAAGSYIVGAATAKCADPGAIPAKIVDRIPEVIESGKRSP